MNLFLSALRALKPSQSACGLGLVCTTILFLTLAALAHAETDSAEGRLITSLAIAVDPATHEVYGVNEPENSVSVLNERTGLVHAIKVGRGPVSIAVDSRANRIYVVNDDSDSVSIIDGTEDKVIGTIHERAGSHPYVIAVDDTTGKVYVTNTYSSALTVIDGATGASYALNTGAADGIAIDRRTHNIFLMTYEDPKIRMVNPATGAVTAIKVGPHLWGMAFDQPTGTLYVAHTLTNNIIALNEKTYRVNTLPVGAIPSAIGINPVTQRVYIVNYGDQTLSVISARSHELLVALPVGEHPQAVAIDSRRNLVYVANVHGNSVTVINGKTNRVLETLPVGENPYALAVDPKTGRVFAANYGAPSITEISTPQSAIGHGSNKNRK